MTEPSKTLVFGGEEFKLLGEVDPPSKSTAKCFAAYKKAQGYRVRIVERKTNGKPAVYLYGRKDRKIGYCPYSKEDRKRAADARMPLFPCYSKW
jgi:hypothetical protein